MSWQIPTKESAAASLRNASQEVLAYLATLLPLIKAWRSRTANHYLELAQRAYGEKQPRKAIPFLERALEWSDSKSEVFASLGLLYYGLEDRERAKREFMISISESFRRDGVSNFRALKGMGIIYHEEGNLREAMYYYLKALEQTAGATDVGVLINLGAIFYNLGQYKESIEYSQRAKEMDPDNPVAMENLGRAAYALGDLDQALGCLKRAAELKPDNSEVARFLALTYRAQGDSTRSYETLKKATARDPQNPDVLLDLAVLCEERGLHEDGAKCAMQAAEYFQQRGQVEREASAYWQLGWCTYNLGDLKRSVEASRKAVQLNPSLFAAQFNIGLALLQLGDTDGARQHYEAAMNTVQEPSDIKFYAVADLKAAQKAHPDLPGALPVLEALERKYTEMTAELQSPRQTAR